jgi:3-oxoadipyl-CoA thiolase
MREVVIVSAVRTPIGRIRGGLSGVRPDDLGGMVIAESLKRAGIDGEQVDEVVFGCANQAGEDNRNVARMALLLAGLPQSVPGMTINRLCASGLSAVNTAFRQIAVGDAEVMVAGGVESMSRAPWVMPKADGPFPTGNVTVYDSSLGWRFPNPAMEKLFPLEPMGETAENLVDRYGLTREAQDAFACESQRRAVAAQKAGAFDAELMPVSIPQRKGPPVVVSQDEGPRAETTLEALAKLGAAFRKGGSVTAGNSSTLNDGAAALVLMSASKAQSLRRTPLARLVATGEAGVDPRVMGIGPVPAIRKCLARAGRTVDDVKLFELNEAFAAQSLAVIQDLGLDAARVNVNGGAIALGHPLGCSGARILTTLVHALRARGGGLGLASLCVGVGQGVATLVEV